MDEKTDVSSEEQLPQNSVQLLTPDAVESNAGNATEADVIPTDSTGTESLISISTDKTVSTDTHTATLTSTETTTKPPIETSISETSTSDILPPADTFISSDALSVADALTSVDDLQSAEELTSASLKASADANAIANKVSSIDAVESSPIVCRLEEELKRLHEGDPVEELKHTVNLPLTKEPAVEKTVREEHPLATAEPVIKPVVPQQAVKLPITKPVAKPAVEQIANELDPVEMFASEEVSKDPFLIKICGSCHEVFHYVEDFQEHKSGKCKGKTSLLPVCEGESKPQVWGFTLWKNRQNKFIKDGDTVPSSWVIYQKWCKLPQTDKDAWITAGQTLQFCSKISTAKVTEFKTKPPPQLKQVEKDPLALDGFAESNKENSIVSNTVADNKPTASDMIKRTIVKPVRLNNDVTILPSNKDFESSGSEYVPEKKGPKEMYFSTSEDTDSDNDELPVLQNQPIQTVIRSKHKQTTFCAVWPETMCGRSGNDLASAFIQILGLIITSHPEIEEIFTWSDSCVPQNRNSLISIAVTDFLHRHPNLKTITMKYSLPGHSCIQVVDNLLSRIEKCLRVQDVWSPILFLRLLKKVDRKHPFNGDANSNKALRTVRSTEKREYVVERIVAKRFNPKRKTWEYQIKWENFSSEENTWEPISNLNHCKQMVEEFEEQLKKLKAEKAKQQAAGNLAKGRGRTIKGQGLSTPSSSSFSSDSTPGRPQRTSKQKALNQVKAWCGNISDADEGSAKRPFEDVDSDDSFEKKMKYEDYSEDDSDVEMKPKTPLRKIVPKPPTVQLIKNGVGRVHPLPQNVLIPDANGVVRINQKQLPSLSTGVYIMSKTAGIIKLDSTTSKVATSGGQTIVKVAPKIGQTQIKIVKKDGTTTTTKQIIQMTPNKSANVPTKIYKPVITKTKKPPEVTPKPAVTKIVIKPKEEVKKPNPPPPLDDDSDDGIEEIPFPVDLPLPVPDSPPRDFTLDPFTGKIAGQEYPEPEPEPVVVKTDIEDSSPENIVKLAAAEITEDDLKNECEEAPMETDDIDTQEDEEIPVFKKTASIASITRSPVTTPSGVRVTMASTLRRNESSILNKALNSSTILRKTLINTAPQPKVQQRILNKTFAPRSHNVTSVFKSVSRNPTVVRTRPVAPRPRFNIASPSNIIKSQHEVSPRNVMTILRYLQFPEVPKSLTPAIATNVSSLDTPEIEPVAEPEPEPEPPVETPAASVDASENTMTTDISSFTLADNENPIFITGDDGTVYQVAGQNEHGQTILLTQGADGQQQCLLVTNEVAESMETSPEEPQADISMPEIDASVTEPLSVKTDVDSSDQVVAQVVRAEPPSPGGTHKVVVMLPDGNLMVTQVSPEEYASLELE
ncbi:hypothetical protein NQ314_003193 [Rhamnusium bicolor]|uniref:Chromo domain-containing protein n=1 Tax=Rhamnusium bicolor TaxID=1586634 RepID=A0AAV8ZQA9_9CUCU|nr:hypothetical protein NQ314_003193 [Rhamnusium bicolor]